MLRPTPAPTFADTFWNEIMLFVFCALAALPAARLIVHARRRTRQPTLAMLGAGLVIGLMGGFDRIDALGSSQLLTDNPPWTARASAILCLAVGCALIGRFLAFLVPLLVRPASHTLDRHGPAT